MDTITIKTENNETFSAVSNFFIDYYMTEANGEFVKVYLYLNRLLASGCSISVAQIADHFNLTEKDICRAIRYWIKQGILKLEYNADKVLTGIVFLPLSPKADSEPDTLASDTSVLEAQAVHETAATTLSETAPETASETNVSSSITEEPVIPEKPVYKAADIQEIVKNEDFSDLIYQVETYFGKQLTQRELQTFTYLFDSLSMNTELLEYLVEYCVSIGKKSCRYIEAVALQWYKSGIHTAEDAKIACKNYNSIYMSVLKQLGIPRRVPTPAEADYIDTWYNQYAFNKNIIMEACRRAVESHPQTANFKYVNGILESWHRQNVHTLADIRRLDEQWAADKKKRQTQKKTGSGNQFNQYQGSNDIELAKEFEKLFIQEMEQ